MSLVVAIIIVLAALAAVSYPLLARTRRRAAPPVTTDSDVQRILDSRDTLLRAFRELEYDNRLGNLSEQDYRSLRSGYEREAVEIYKALDARAGALPDDVEREVELARAEVEPAEEHDTEHRP